MTPFVTGMRTRLENPLTEAENEGEKERRAQMRWRKRVLKGSRRSKGGGGQGRQKAQRYYYWLKFFVAGVDLPRAPADCAISLRSSRGSAPSNPFFSFFFLTCSSAVLLLFLCSSPRWMHRPVPRAALQRPARFATLERTLRARHLLFAGHAEDLHKGCRLANFVT